MSSSSDSESEVEIVPGTNNIGMKVKSVDLPKCIEEEHASGSAEVPEGEPVTGCASEKASGSAGLPEEEPVAGSASEHETGEPVTSCASEHATCSAELPEEEPVAGLAGCASEHETGEPVASCASEHANGSAELPEEEPVAGCVSDGDLGELEAVDLYTPTQSWQAAGMWFSDYTGYTESLEEAEQVLQEYEIATGSKYIVDYKRANFGKTFLDVHQAKHKINWEVSSNPAKDKATTCGSVIIPFDGVPFIFAGKKAFGCRYGQDKGVAAKLKWKKNAAEKVKLDPNFKLRAPRIQPSMKLGCKAQVHITHIIRFPEYEVTKDTSYQRRTVSDKLRLAIHKVPFVLEPVDRFYLILCDPKNHNHPLKDAELARKAHNLRQQSQTSRKKARRKRQSGPDEMAAIQKELQTMNHEISASASTRCAKVLEKLINATFMVENADKLAELEQKASDLLKDTNTSIHDDGTVTENSCIGRLDNTSGSNNKTVILPLTIVQQDTSLTETVPIDKPEEGCQRGAKRKTSDEEEGVIGEGDELGVGEVDVVPVTQSIEYVNVPGGEPSIVYTYGTNNRVYIYD